MSPGRRCHTRWIVALAASSLAFSSLSVRGQQIRTFALSDDREGLFEFLVRQKNDQRSNDHVPSWDARELEFIERLGWGTGGYVYHPYFVRFRFFAMLELQQDHYSGFSWDRRRDNKVLPQGRFDLTLLEMHPTTFNFFGDRQESEVDRAFARSFPLLEETIGGAFHFKKGPLPFRLRYRHNRREGYEAGSDIRDRTDEVRVESNYTAGDRSRGTLSGDWTDIWEDVQQRRLQRLGFSASNVSWFDPERSRQLTSAFRSTRQKSISETSAASLSETFSWRHSHSLGTNYRFRLDRNTVDAQIIDSLEGRAGVNHQLYESLSSRLDGFLYDQRSTQGSSRRVGGTLGESYTKGLGSWARLGLSLGLNTETLVQDRIEDFAQVANEPHTLSGEQPVPLANLDIDIATVTVTDDRGALFYSAGEDYLLIVRGAVTEIARLALGDIPDGGIVLVSYRFRLPPSSRVATRGGGGEVRLDLGNWLSLRSGLDRLHQTQEAGLPGVRLESLKRIYGDVRATWRWAAGGVAYDNRDSILSPQTSLSEYLTLSTITGRGHRFLISASHQLSRYPDDGVRMRSVGVFGSLAVPLGYRGRLEGEARWRRDLWSGQPGFNNLDDRGVKLSFEWRLVDLIFTAGGRLSRIKRGTQSDDTSRIFVGLRREF
jgi:hypothetical protein